MNGTIGKLENVMSLVEEGLEPTKELPESMLNMEVMNVQVLQLLLRAVIFMNVQVKEIENI